MKDEFPLLETYSTEELWRELSNRHHSCVLLYEEKDLQDNVRYGFVEGGSSMSTLGLLQFAATILPMIAQKIAMGLSTFQEGEQDAS